MKTQASAPEQPAGRKSRPGASPHRRRTAAAWNAALHQMQTQRFQAINTMAEGLSHELGNLLAGIMNSAEVAAMEIPEGHPSHESLKNLFVSSSYAADFNRRLATFCHRTPSVPKPIRLRPVVEECLQVLRTIMPAKVELQARLDTECPAIHGDAAQLHQAILDVCLYSWQGLADRGGQICVWLDNQVLAPATVRQQEGLPPGPYVRLVIEDSSAGLDARSAQRIFHPFGPRRGSAPKVGLELFAVREIIQEHHGDILLETEPGRGLKFLIYLPATGE